MICGDCTARSLPFSASVPPVSTLLDVSRYAAPPPTAIDEPRRERQHPAAAGRIAAHD